VLPIVLLTALTLGPSATPAPFAPRGAQAAAAGAIPPSVSLEVTGRPADPAFLERRIRAAIRNAIAPTLAPGAVVAYGPIVPPMPPLEPGFLRTVTVPVTIRAPGFATVSGTTEVDITNVDIASFAPPILYFDDDPESIAGDGVLLDGTIDPARPVRLYYYHEDVGVSRRVVVLLSAVSKPSRVQIIESESGPDVDVMSVGHAASRDFLLVEPRNEGVIADVTPGAPYIVRDVLVSPTQVVAGVVDFRVLSDAPVEVFVLAIGPGDDPASRLAGPRLPGDGHNRHGTFDISGYGEIVVAYTVGGPDASYRYGGDDVTPPNLDPRDIGRDHGDYGVLHRVTFDLANPSSEDATVYLYEKPLGGPVRSSFLVDGELKELGCARLPREYEIASYTLPPRSNRTTSIVTMPDGGSSYPLEIGITATPPIAQTPPIDAPDGCFPKPSS